MKKERVSEVTIIVIECLTPHFGLSGPYSLAMAWLSLPISLTECVLLSKLASCTLAHSVWKDEKV